MRNVSFPLFSGLLALALVPLLLAAFRPPQDAAEPPQDPFRQQMVWNFAVLQYVDARGELVEVPAKDLVNLRLLAAAEGQLRLELLYENKDYSSLAISDFHLIRSSPVAPASDVPVVRSRLEGMAFPAFAENR